MSRLSILFVVLLVASVCLVVSCTIVQPQAVGDKDDPNFKDGIYVNNHIDHPNKSFWAFLRLRWFGDEVWADHEKASDLIPKTDIELTRLKEQTQQVTWLGHSTFLVQLNGINILTDPVFSERASPVSFAGPKRYTPVATDIASLPKIDAVIISHNHYDHLDIASIQALGNQPKYFVPSGLRAWFIEAGVDEQRVFELKWWQQHVEQNLVLTATPSQHWSARGIQDRHFSHWASWLVKVGDTQFWFAGDTGYNGKDFVAIGEHVKQQNASVDFALIPIGAYAPRDFMKSYHVNTEEAVQIHKDVGAKLSIGMHWGAFPLTSEWPMEPYENLNALRKANKLGPYPFETLKIGETKQLD